MKKSQSVLFLKNLLPANPRHPNEPGAEHKLLDPLTGRWKVAGKYWPAPGADPQVVGGQVEAEWVLGRRLEAAVA